MDHVTLDKKRLYYLAENHNSHLVVTPRRLQQQRLWVLTVIPNRTRANA